MYLTPVQKRRLQPLGIPTCEISSEGIYCSLRGKVITDVMFPTLGLQSQSFYLQSPTAGSRPDSSEIFLCFSVFLLPISDMFNCITDC